MTATPDQVSGSTDSTEIKVLSLRLAMPREVDTAKGPLRTGMLKREVDEAVMLQPTGLYGDGWADLEHHGLEDQAICAYPLEHYAPLAEQMNLELKGGSFGENIVVTGADETTALIGDQLRWGEALLEVTKARAPCATLNEVWNCSTLAAELGRSGRTGWYLRVLEPGMVEGGQQMELVSREANAQTVRQQWFEK
jgi:MOSC domain-containing protein YiiM